MTMHNGRVVVLGLNADGSGRVARDEQLEPMPWPTKTGPRFDLWGSDGPISLPLADELPPVDGLFPPTGGVRFRMAEFSPGHGVDAPSTIEGEDDEQTGVATGLSAGSIKGIHATESADFGVVLSGEIDCILDSGEAVRLRPGDTYVMLGAPHKWVNQGPEPCVFAAIMIGVPAGGDEDGS